MVIVVNKHHGVGSPINIDNILNSPANTMNNSFFSKNNYSKRGIQARISQRLTKESNLDMVQMFDKDVQNI